MTSNKTSNSKQNTNPGALIYVVDDEPMLLELATVVLEPHGYRIETFRDPSAALEAFRQSDPRPALVITDYAMHQMNGMDLIKECKKLQPSQKILLVSGTVGEEVYRGSAAKPDRFLAKPYQAVELTDIVRSLLAK